MSLKINLEIGHEATLRAKNTPEGFTHDWKIFVRGCDGANIHYYVEKVVFYLHETFQKPRRVIKEPPYSVKESGYAGFIIPIEIYLRTGSEPKKIKFSYDLSLQRTGPPVRKVKREKYVFTSPPDDLRDKLLKGGAVVTSNSQESSENKSVLHEEKNQLISKPKLSGDIPPKKPKFDPPLSNSFQDLFGTPITKTSKPPETKVSLPAKENKSNSKPEKDRSADKVKNKHIPQKDKERERDKTERKEKKEEKKKDKERRDKDRERNKEKSSKMDKSPKIEPPSPKNTSPKPSSPVSHTSQGSSSERHREKDSKMISDERDKTDKGDDDERKSRKEKKERDKEKHRESSKNETKNKETRSKEGSSQGPDSASHMPTESKTDEKHQKKDDQKGDETREAERKDKPEEKKHKHKKKDKKKERRDDEEKKTKTPPKVEKEKSPEVILVSNTSSSPRLEIDLSETNDLFSNSPEAVPSTSRSGETRAESYAPVPEIHSVSSGSSRSSSPMQEDYDGATDSARKRKRSNSSDLEESPTKLRKANTEPVSGDEEMSDVEEVTNPTLPYTRIDPETGQEIEYYEMGEEEYYTLLALKQRINDIRGTPLMEKVIDLVSDTGNFEITETFDFNLSELDEDTIAELLVLLPPPSTSTSASPSSTPSTSASQSPAESPAQSPVQSPAQSVSPSPSPSASRSPSPTPS
ncbi:protein ENL [Coccinella septempunctata]|uniref:protein ENL n=1 Tax=Coccinella septempunctata TaxID=41139 RepID=UPI001D0673C6|nr:protein ENL [Coccinella septempunctata]